MPQPEFNSGSSGGARPGFFGSSLNSEQFPQETSSAAQRASTFFREQGEYGALTNSERDAYDHAGQKGATHSEAYSAAFKGLPSSFDSPETSPLIGYRPSIRHLSGEQFMSAPAFRKVKAGDFPGGYDQSVGGMQGLRVGDLHRDQKEGGYRKYDWDRLHSDLDAEGMKSPLYVTHDKAEDDDPILRNGHHRAVASLERGMMFIPVTDQPNWDDDRGYRHSKQMTLKSKPHWFSGNERTARPPLKKEIPGQLALFAGPQQRKMQGRTPPKRNPKQGSLFSGG